MIKPLHAYAIGAGVLVLAAFWLSQKGALAGGASVGSAIGSAAAGVAVGLVGGVVTGVSGAVVDAANNPSVNPLQPFGAWVGSTIYDVTHWGQ